MFALAKSKIFTLIFSTVCFIFIILPLKANSRLEQIKTMEQEIQSLRGTLVDLEARLTSSNSQGAELANKLQNAIDERKVVVLASRARSAMLEIDQHAKQEYKRAYLLLANGKVEEAQKAFEDFVQNNMGDSYVVNAKYWLGEIRYYFRDYKAANQDFIYVYRNSTSEYYKPYALYRVLEMFSALQRTEDTCKVAAALSQKHLDKFFSFEVSNIKSIAESNNCKLNIKEQSSKVDENAGGQNPFGRDSKILPNSPSSIAETFTEQDKEVLNSTLGKDSTENKSLKELDTPDISQDNLNNKIENNSLYRMKSSEGQEPNSNQVNEPQPEDNTNLDGVQGNSYNYE